MNANLKLLKAVYKKKCKAGTEKSYLGTRRVTQHSLDPVIRCLRFVPAHIGVAIGEWSQGSTAGSASGVVSVYFTNHRMSRRMLLVDEGIQRVKTRVLQLAS